MKIRNRVHIQNIYNCEPGKERSLFLEGKLITVQKILETFIRKMISHYIRGPEYHYVEDFVLPWDSHYGTLRKNPLKPRRDILDTWDSL